MRHSFDFCKPQKMDFTLKAGSLAVLLAALYAMPLYQSVNDSLAEFFERNPECSQEDTESVLSLLNSAFKKSDLFKPTLLAVSGAFFLSRLFFELGRIILTAQERERQKK